MSNASTRKNEQPGSQGRDAVQVGWLQSMGSSVAAAFGVQSYKNRERDFQHGDIRKFVVSGLVLTVAILLSLVGLVQWVLLTAS